MGLHSSDWLVCPTGLTPHRPVRPCLAFLLWPQPLCSHSDQAVWMQAEGGEGGKGQASLSCSPAMCQAHHPHHLCCSTVCNITCIGDLVIHRRLAESISLCHCRLVAMEGKVSYLYETPIVGCCCSVCCCTVGALVCYGHLHEMLVEMAGMRPM